MPGFILRALALMICTIWYSVLALGAFAVGMNRNVYFRLARTWSAWLLRIAGIKVQVHGLDYMHHAPGSRVYVVNHTSYFDIPILLASLPDDIRIMYRENLEKIPFLGWSLRASPFIGIKREDARNAMAGIEAAVQAVQKGESVIVFAEGTRSADGRLGTFKRGAFLLASRSGKPILPIALAGAQHIMPRDARRFYPGQATLTVLPPIFPPASPGKKEEKEVLQAVYHSIKQALPNDMQPAGDHTNG